MRTNLLAIISRLKAWPRFEINRLRNDENGQTMVEYVMLIVLVALALFLLSPNIVDAIMQVFSNTSSALA
jgi:Flp pilus assembly pilin Flp